MLKVSPVCTPPRVMSACKIVCPASIVSIVTPVKIFDVLIVPPSVNVWSFAVTPLKVGSSLTATTVISVCTALTAEVSSPLFNTPPESCTVKPVNVRVVVSGSSLVAIAKPMLFNTVCACASVVPAANSMLNTPLLIL